MSGDSKTEKEFNMVSNAPLTSRQRAAFSSLRTTTETRSNGHLEIAWVDFSGDFIVLVNNGETVNNPKLPCLFFYNILRSNTSPNLTGSDDVWHENVSQGRTLELCLQVSTLTEDWPPF